MHEYTNLATDIRLLMNTDIWNVKYAVVVWSSMEGPIRH